VAVVGAVGRIVLNNRVGEPGIVNRRRRCRHTRDRLRRRPSAFCPSPVTSPRPIASGSCSLNSVR
jgi:hypothetical protein